MFGKTLVCAALLSVLNASDCLAQSASCRTTGDPAPKFARGAYPDLNKRWHYSYTTLVNAPRATRYGPVCSRTILQRIPAGQEVRILRAIWCTDRAGALDKYVEIGFSGYFGITPLGWTSRSNLENSDRWGLFQPPCPPYNP
jgi:hypothetical protein